jgi:coenzyme Q-binding protein COQ10
VARYTTTRRLPYAPEQVFALVADVERYPEFIPWITSLRTWNAKGEANGPGSVDAEASVGFSFLRERFATRVTRDPEAKVIDVGLLSGPFRKLANQWRFVPDGEGTRVEFVIDFEFRARLLDALLRANFDRAVNRLIVCFEARAAQLYG